MLRPTPNYSSPTRCAWLGAGALAVLCLLLWDRRSAAQTLDNPLPLVLGQRVTGLTDRGGTNDGSFFILRVPSHARLLVLTFTEGTGDGDLFARRLSEPYWEYFSNNEGNSESITVVEPQPGDWIVGVFRWNPDATPYTNATLTASLRGPAVLTGRFRHGESAVGFAEIIPDHVYTLQRATELSTNATWTTVARAIGVAVPGSLVDPNPPATRAFYRVLDEPEPAGGFDGDGDGVRDYLEVTRYGTNPRLVDTDGDGWSDADEIVAGSDPLDPTSMPRMTIMAGGSVSLTLLRDNLTPAATTLTLLRENLILAPISVKLTRTSP